MKALERKALKERITQLAQKQFGGLLKKVRFSGPFEDEDLDVDIILRKKIGLNEMGAKLWNIHKPLRKEGYDVLIGCEFDERSKKEKTKRKSGSQLGNLLMNDAHEQEINTNLERAEQSVQAAKLLLAEGYHDFAASRAYYAAFYAATVALLHDGLEYSKQQCHCSRPSRSCQYW